jgi:hypothetical protein
MQIKIELKDFSDENKIIETTFKIEGSIVTAHFFCSGPLSNGFLER